jgi:hypothetical protein
LDLASTRWLYSQNRTTEHSYIAIQVEKTWSWLLNLTLHKRQTFEQICQWQDTTWIKPSKIAAKWNWSSKQLGPYKV